MTKSLNHIKRDLLEKFENDTRGEVASMMGVAILAIVALVVIATLGSALIPSAITTASDTSQITNYSTWKQGTKDMFTTVPTFIGLAYMLIYVAIALLLVKVATG